MMHLRIRPLMLAVLSTCPFPVLAAGIPTLQEVTVNSSSKDLIGVADSASEGTVTAKQLANRPLLRPAEVLEVVPGMIVTQHSGDGKANQYFLRGFNLDHGTDFATYVAGVPVNMPSHAHGQGYTDLNFLIPELVDRVSFRKEIGTMRRSPGCGCMVGTCKPASTPLQVPIVRLSRNRPTSCSWHLRRRR